MPATHELAERAQHGDRVDPRMPREAPVLGGDQHPQVQRIDPIGLDRQAPFAVGGEKPAQYRAVARQHQRREIAAAVEVGRREGEVGGYKGG